MRWKCKRARILTCYGYTARMNNLGINRKTRWPWALATVTALTGALLSFWAWHRLHVAEQRSVEQAFHAQAQNARAAVEQEIALFTSVLDSVRALHTLSEQISPEDFEEFVGKGMVHQRAILGSFGFAQRIGHDVRVMLEAAFLQDPDSGYAVVEYDGGNTFRAASSRPEYFPLTWRSDPEVMAIPIGYDFGSSPQGQEAVERMLHRGRITLARSGKSGTPDYHVFAPIIYRPSDEPVAAPRGGVLVGFAVAPLNPSHILQRALADRFPASWSLTFVPLEDSGTLAKPDHARWHESMIAVADMPWLFRCVPATPSGVVDPSKRAAMVLWGGFLITALVTSQLLLLAGRTERIEQVVQARTVELREANAQLEKEIEERARLEQAIEEVALRERQKLGRDLHDSLGQKLTGAVFLSRSLLGHFEGKDQPETEHARKLNATLKEAVGQVRGLARGLAPLALNEDNLHEALEQLARDMTALFAIPCTYSGDSDISDWNPQVREQIYLIAQEAVNNAMRHASPSRVEVMLFEDERGQELMIADDGCGLPGATDTRREGLGLRIMQHRAQIIGGVLEIESGPVQGTRIICRLNRG